jgi:hypothetical protein
MRRLSSFRRKYRINDLVVGDFYILYRLKYDSNDEKRLLFKFSHVTIDNDIYDSKCYSYYGECYEYDNNTPTSYFDPRISYIVRATESEILEYFPSEI